MKKSNKITDIIDEPISFIGDSPLAIDLCCIKHTPVHVHNTVSELVYCLEGHIDLYRNHERMRINAGEMTTINYFDMHCLYSDTDNVTLLVYMDFSHESINYGNLFTAYIDCEDGSARPFQSSALHNVKARLLAMSYAWFNGKLTQNQATKASQELMSVLLSDFNWFNQLDSFPNENPELFSRITDVVTYVMENYKEKLSISYFAQRLNISDNYVSQFFKRSPYGSFSLLVGFIRCLYAQRLLLNSELSVMEIGLACGFSDYKYFFKYFSYWWGVKPSDYKKWFSEYVKHPDSITCLSPSDALQFLDAYVSDFFVNMYV